MLCKPIEGLSGLAQRDLGLVRLHLQLVAKVLDVGLPLLREGSNIAPWSLTEHARSQINQCGALPFTVMAVRKADARANGKVGGDAASAVAGKEGVEHRIGDGVFGQHCVNLLDAEVDFIQTFAEGFHLLRKALELGTVHHGAQPAELLGVEEARDGVKWRGRKGIISVTCIYLTGNRRPLWWPRMNEHCSPTYGKVDDVLEMLTKSKSLHILMVLDRASGPLRFTELKEGVKASSTTVSRRIKELEANGLVVRLTNPNAPQLSLYALSSHATKLSPVMQSLYEWAEQWTMKPV